jgi:predicted permease
MRGLKRLLMRVRNLVTARRSDERLREELESHLAMQTDENIRAGMPPAEAARHARLKLGAVEAIRERYHAEEGIPLLDELMQDLRFALRQMRKSPGFTLVAVLTLALGIGANTAVFSLIDALFLKPLPFPDAKQLVHIYARGPSGRYGAGFSMPEFEQLRQRTTSFSDVSVLIHRPQLNLVTRDGSAGVSGAFVSGNYFSLLRVQPHFGRAFLPEEDTVPDRNAVAVISDNLWKIHFNSDPGVLGRQIQINGAEFTVIGVAPPEFHGELVGQPEEVWIPAMMLGKAGLACDDGSYNCSLVDIILGRLAPGISPVQAQAECGSDMLWSASDWPERPSRRQVVLFPAGSRWPDRPSETVAQMRLLMAVTGSLLLIACGNLAGLLLARGASRKREIALRLAIGARHARVVRQLLTENISLSAIGGTVGIGLSFAMERILSRFYATDSEGFHHLYDLTVDWRILVYAVVLTFATGVLFGLVPAIMVSHQDLNGELKEGGPAVESTGTWLRHSLVVGQVALSIVLVVSTALLVRSGIDVERGTNFDPTHVVVLRLRPELLKYTPQQVEALLLESVRRIRSAPGVKSLAFMEGGEGLVWDWQSGRDTQISLPGSTKLLPHNDLTVVKQDVSAGFFHTLGTPLLQGRDFDNGDRPDSPRVAIVNEALALRLWPPGQAVGQTLIVNGVPFQVAGVTANLQPLNPLQSPEPHMYLSYWQSGAFQEGDIRMAIRIAGDPTMGLSAMRRIIRSINPAVPIGEDMTMSDQVSLEYMPVLLARSVMSFCGLLALCLGAIGLYSALAFAVRTRTREIGIRIALGARRQDVMGMIVRQGVRLTLVGIFIGSAAALLLTKLEASLLYGVRTTDPIIYGSVAVLLFLTAFAACILPARRAASIDPMEALRAE